MSRSGISQDTTVVFYGDRNNWWACYAYWVFQLFGHSNAKVMDGGRQKWEQEGRALVREVPTYAATGYSASERNDAPSAPSARTCLRTSMRAGSSWTCAAPQEYSGERLHMPDFPNEGALRGGHIPTARSIPWGARREPRGRPPSRRLPSCRRST